MLVLKKYDLVRNHLKKLVLGTSFFTRGDDKETFLASLQEEGFKLHTGAGEEVHLKAISAQFSYSIAGAEVLFMELDPSLDEERLKPAEGA